MNKNIIKNISNALLKKSNIYQKIRLDEQFIIEKDFLNIKNILLDIIDISKCKIYISKTFICDSINIMQINNSTFIEFENEQYEYENKGLNNSIEINL